MRLIIFLLILIVTFVSVFIPLLAFPIDFRKGRIFQLCGLFWSSSIIKLLGMRLKLVDPEGLLKGKKPTVFVCNHSSIYDIPPLMKSLPKNARFTHKKQLNMIPGFGWLLRVQGISIDRNNRKLAYRQLSKTAQKLNKGFSVIFFPEGTRSKTGALGSFKRGAFHLAKEADLPIVLLLVSGTKDVSITNWQRREVVVRAFATIPREIVASTEITGLRDLARELTSQAKSEFEHE